MGGVFFPHQPTSQQSEAGLHEENQIARVKRPGEIGGDADVADAIGEFDSQRLFGGLGLIVVKVLLVFGVVRRSFVGGFSDDKRISGGVDGGRFVSRSGSGGIGLGGVVGEAESWDPGQHSHDQKNDCSGGYERQARMARPGSLHHRQLLLCQDMERGICCGVICTPRLIRNCRHATSPIHISYRDDQKIGGAIRRLQRSGWNKGAS